MKKIIQLLTMVTMALMLTACGSSITMEEAREIALSDAGVSQEEVTITKEKQSDDDFELAFRTEDTAYEYEIRRNGTIDSKEKEMLQGTVAATETPRATEAPTEEATPTDQATNTPAADTPTETPAADAAEGISEEQAQEIALQRAGLTADQIQFYEIRQDMERGVLVYEIEFNQDRTEYSVDINVATGEIVKFETDMDD